MEELLEVVPELTSRFEVVVVDDASTDATVETAQELSLRFPQVQLLLQPQRLGSQEALRSALRYSHGELLFVCSVHDDFDLHELRKLWDRRTAEGAVFANVDSRPAADKMSTPLVRTNSADVSGIPDILLVPRRLLSMWGAQGERTPLCPFLRSRGFSLTNVELRRRSAANAARRTHSAASSSERVVPTPLRPAPPATTSSGTRRPSFLSRIAAFGRSE